MQDQAVQDMEAWLTGWQQGQLGVSLGVHRSRHGGRVPARAGTDRTSQEGRADAHAGRRQHRGGNRLGGGRPRQPHRPTQQPYCRAASASIVIVVRQHLDSHQPAGAATAPCKPPPRRRQAGPMAACTTAGQPMAAPQTTRHHTAVDSILHFSVAAGSPGDPRAHRSQGAGSSQGPDAPRLAPGGIRHQAASRCTQPLAQRKAAGHAFFFPSHSDVLQTSLPPEAGRCPRTDTDARIDPAPKSSPPATQHHVGDVEGMHAGRALQQRQGKPGSAGLLGPFSGAGAYKAI